MNNLANSSPTIKETINEWLPPFLKDRYEGVAQVLTNEHQSVYIVQQLLLDHLMELHIAHAGGNEKLRGEFEQRAKIRSALLHASLPAVHDFGLLTNGDPFMLIDLPLGVRLDSMLRSKGARPAVEALALVENICGALAVVHEQGLEHGELSSSDIVVSDHGNTSIVSLGFGAFVHQDNASNGVDADIKSLARILLEALTGRPQSAHLFDVAAIDACRCLPEFKNSPKRIPERLCLLLEGILLSGKSARAGEVQSTLRGILKELISQEIKAYTLMKAPLVVLTVLVLFALIVSTLFLMSDHKPAATAIAESSPASLSIAAALAHKSPDADNKLVIDLTSRMSKGRLVLRDLSIDDKGLQYLETVNEPIMRLDLSDTHISDVSMKYITHFPLFFLDITRNNITDAGVKELSENCPHLRSLRMGNTKITAKGVAYLKKIAVLESLNLYNNDLGDEVMTALSKCKRLEKIDLENNPRLTDAGLAKLNSPKLKNINLTGTSITDKGLTQLLRMRRLDNLHLGNTDKITDAGVKVLVKMPLLKRLTLRRTNVTSQGLLVLLRARNLVELNIPGMQLDDATRDAFSKARPGCKITINVLSRIQQ